MSSNDPSLSHAAKNMKEPKSEAANPDDPPRWASARVSAAATAYPEMNREIVNLLRTAGENYELYAASRIEELEAACRIALWIRDRLQERGSWGAGFEEWQDIERALTPNNPSSATGPLMQPNKNPVA